MDDDVSISQRRLLPEEDAIDDPDDDDEADPLVPGDLWYSMATMARGVTWNRRRILGGGQAIRR